MSEFQKMEELGDSLKQYMLLNYEIIKLEATKKTSEVGASLFGFFVLGITIFLFVVSLSIGIGFYLSYLLGDSFSGFMIVAGFYLLVSVILYFRRKKLVEKSFRNFIIKELLEDKKS